MNRLVVPLFVWSTILASRVLSLTPNTLNGQHLRVIWSIFDKESVLLELADLLIPDIYPTYQRNMVIDMTVVWIFDNLACLIPITDETANINAVGKPFQWPVWLGLGISMICVIAILNLMQRYLEYRSTFEKSSNLMTNSGRQVKKTITGKQYLYVFANLLSQGGPCTSKRLPYRVVAGVWTLAAFVFVQAYTSTLFTYVVMPINHPLVNTINDIAEHPDINLMVKTAGTMDRLILIISLNRTCTGMYKKLGERLNSNPNSRCTLVSDCIKLITPGSRNVFVDAKVYLMDAIRAEFKKTGKCNLQIAKEGILTTYATLVLSKHSPFTKSINQGLLDLIQTGIINYWDLWFRPMPGKCMRNFNSGFNMPDEKHKPLSLKNLSGAFVVIAVGLSLSLLAFLGEMIVSMKPARLR
ncbi:ionotropic receptor 21a-like [Daphnia pulicaria]|uniref:ionotropic receptor 21a-like n=1 Tax=Daphnia pulicaria TaxID=35523 RepID=UPI001EEC0BC3|nr:ionotropic receptor 21a-like [Daphnia pulicaria]